MSRGAGRVRRLAGMGLDLDDREEREKATQRLAELNVLLTKSRMFYGSRATLPKNKKPTKKTVRNRAWRICSEYVRRSHADDDGMVQCTTCNVKRHWRDMHAGHFIPRPMMPCIS